MNLSYSKWSLVALFPVCFSFSAIEKTSPCPEWYRDLRKHSAKLSKKPDIFFSKGNVKIVAQPDEFSVSRNGFGIYGNLLEGGKLSFLVIAKKTDGSRDPDFRGARLFDAMVQHFGKKVVCVEDIWRKPIPGRKDDLGDNYRLFEEAERKGLTPEQAAGQTWTGIQACRVGYCHAVVRADFEDPHVLNERSIEVEFYADEGSAKRRREEIQKKNSN